MAVADKSIDPVLLQCAKEEFLKEGFDNASVNVICKNAGVTTGALYKRFASKEDLFWAVVNPVIDKLKDWFVSEHQVFANSTIEEQMQVFNKSKYHKIFLDFIYNDYDEYKIIIDGSNQSQCARFLDFFIDLETEYVVKFIKNVSPDIFEKNIISEQTIHIIFSAYFSGMIEVVRHNEKKEDSLIYVEQLQKFYNSGWESIVKDNFPLLFDH